MGTFTYGDGEVAIGGTNDIVLRRVGVDPGDKESFRLYSEVTYHDDHASGASYTVPPDDQFRTDLASVPQLLTWLVPKSGLHLPAALVHDDLVDQPSVDRYEADRMFRDGMGDLGVGFIRRWIMWTAVSIKTIEKRGSTYIRVGAVLTGLIVLVLGALATASLFSDANLLPWMGVRSWWEELLLGGAGAVVIPFVLGLLLWQPIWRAGVIAGVGAALLVHAMTLIALLYGGYLVAERLPRPAQYAAGALVLAASVVAFAYGLTT